MGKNETNKANTAEMENEEKVSKKKKSKSSSSESKFSLAFLTDDRFVKSSGIFIILVSLYLAAAFVSYFVSWYSWNSDDIFTQIGFLRVLFDQDIEVHNITGRLGAAFAQLLIKNSFGISAFFLLYLTVLVGFRLLFETFIISFPKAFKHSLFALFWLPTALGFFLQGTKSSVFGGVFGYEWSFYFQGLLGKPGLIILLFFTLISFLIFSYNLLQFIPSLAFLSAKKESEAAPDFKNYRTEGLTIDDLAKLHHQDEVKSEVVDLEEEVESEGADEFDFELRIDEKVQPPKGKTSEPNFEIENYPQEKEFDSEEQVDDIDLAIEEGEEEKVMDENIVHHGIDTLYDPTEDLHDFKYPDLDLLKEHSASNEITIDKEELEENKNRIVSTLANYAIQIDKIKATVGPTITLYEIVPAPGIRISKIKNLEDDIAMSLAALGIRIIAPIPGRGTIGIEVPNKNAEIVSMRTIIASEKFQTSKFDLPVALGKTISNETFVFDLAKMPHLLVAGATGQGKSVGLNAIITSLLYKKHPAQLKFVMVDPKKVEFSLFSKIERHYLAKLPDRADAIITDTKEVINTLNSLCIEMDDRYELLKTARAKNLKEYNTKFVNRQLNPENGHRYMPFIVLIVDEFADLIMTAGREVEAPIARLAQLARAIGIHLVIATQRPSVNVITGLIKANFPARIAFRVTSKIDSRTILDAGGADQLIGRGDMLFSKGDGLIRLQCAFIDTPEVEDIVDYIGQQRGYASAFNLPEFVGDEEGGKNTELEMGERDPMFDEAARVIVQHQQGSTSLIQRKMKLGYNRAGRIIDQLEMAGVVGPYGGSKAREVLIKDMVYLEQFLEELRRKNF